jgi:hypothetical protein
MTKFRAHCERILGEDNVEPVPTSKQKLAMPIEPVDETPKLDGDYFELWGGSEQTIKSLSAEIDSLDTMISERGEGSPQKLRRLRKTRNVLIAQCRAIEKGLSIEPPKPLPPKKPVGTFWERLQANHK